MISSVRVLYALGLAQVLRQVFKKKLVILTYHGFRQSIDAGALTPYLGNHIWADDFEQHLQYIQRYYVPISLEEALQSLSDQKPLVPGAAVVTMDDGYRSVGDIAFPLLKKYSIPASVFLTTGFLDHENPLWTDRLVYAVVKTTKDSFVFETGEKKLQFPLLKQEERRLCIQTINPLMKIMPQEERDDHLANLERLLDVRLNFGEAMPEFYQPLDWDQVRRMQDSGLVSFGAHTRHHVILSRCQRDFCQREIRDSKERISQETGRPCLDFCYPNGERGDFDESTTKILRDNGFRSALTTVHGFNDTRTDRMYLRRISVVQGMGKAEVAMQMVLYLKLFNLIKARIKKLLFGENYVRGCS